MSNRIFTCEYDARFSNENAIKLDILLNLKHAFATLYGSQYI